MERKLMRRFLAGMIAATLLIGGLPGGTRALADDGPQHRLRQARPAMLGVSGGNVNDRDKRYVYGGTLGGLVIDGGAKTYILSNNHVLARTNAAPVGEAIIQPGLIDQIPVGYANPADVVANLTRFVTIQFKARKTVPLNTVDAAIAQTVAGAVRPDGAILDVGAPGAGLAAAFLGQGVKKSGRTTGLTQGAVQALNVTVDVTYNRQVARFVNQIMISPGAFSAGGDSGSLIVENVAVAPKAVGLLFAGSSSVTVANPIGEVLAQLGVSMVGAAAPAPLAAKPALALARAAAVKQRNEAALLAVDGVLGTGVSAEKGQPVIQVYLVKDSLLSKSKLPKTLEAIPVRIVVTGPIVAF